MINQQPTIGIIHNYDLIDDFLDSMNLTFPEFCDSFTGSFLFGYIEALQTAGIRPILFCITAWVKQPTRLQHRPTGATICALPHASVYHVYRSFKSVSLKAYGAEKGQTFKDIEDTNYWRHSMLSKAKNWLKSGGVYLATPFRMLARELQRENCRALLCQEYEYARFDTCVAMGKMINLPVYACFQGSDETQSFIENSFRRWALDSCAGLIIASGREIERVRDKYRIPTAKIHQIFNPLNLPLGDKSQKAAVRKELGIPLEAKVVVWHGRIEMAQKGLDILIRAWKKLCSDRNNKNLKLLIIGTGSDASKFQQQIASSGLQNIIWLDKFISDRYLISRYLNTADLYTLPSRKEGFPLAPIEAMACELPVVVTNVAGMQDILPEGEVNGGIIVSVDDYQALANAISRLLDNDSLRLEMGAKARKRAKSCFSLKAIGQQMRNILVDE